ncbi:MAG: hypothetical protein IPL62_04675 [Caulobacteraceae bacterium]|nr:hypothetical protein [Caulobacteraceae bacterium]
MLRYVGVVFAAGGVICIVQLAVVIGVKISEDLLVRGRGFGARDPAIFVGVDVNIATAVPDDDAVA